MKSSRSVERALEVLKSFASQPSQVARDIQTSVKLSRPTLYRLLATLEAKGFLTSAGDPRRFEVAEIVLQLANARLALSDISRAGTSHLQHLWELTGETVALIVQHGAGDRIIIQEIRSNKPLSLSLGIGYTAPLHIGASGKAILAFLGAEERAVVLRRIRSKPDRDLLAKALARVGKDRFCASAGEVMPGGASIAAPIFSREGRVAGAVTVFGPEARLRGDALVRSVRWVREAAEGITRGLGVPAAQAK